MTVAIAEARMSGEPYDSVTPMKDWYKRHPHAGYGKTFARWAAHPTDHDPYTSWGNGSAMRVYPIAWAFDSLDAVVRIAAASAAVTPQSSRGNHRSRGCSGMAFLAIRRSPAQCRFAGRGSDMQACIAGSIAGGFHGKVPEPLRGETPRRLDDDLRTVVVVALSHWRGT